MVVTCDAIEGLVLGDSYDPAHVAAVHVHLRHTKLPHIARSDVAQWMQARRWIELGRIVLNN